MWTMIPVHSKRKIILSLCIFIMSYTDFCHRSVFGGVTLKPNSTDIFDADTNISRTNNTVEVNNRQSEETIRESNSTDNTTIVIDSIMDFLIYLYGIDTDVCAERRQCNSTEMAKTCECDRLCGVLQDCCEDAVVERDQELTRDQFSCIKIPRRMDSFVVVTKCALTWNDSNTKDLCERSDRMTDNNLLRVPVSDFTESRFIYKNMYCAHCNFVYEYEFWKAKVMCQRALPDFKTLAATNRCDLNFEMPVNSTNVRRCDQASHVISTCPESYIVRDIQKNCENGQYSRTYSDKIAYRNEFCATCNGVEKNDLLCWNGTASRRKPKGRIHKWYSFRMLVDFNSGQSEVTIRDQQFNRPVDACRDSEIYDPYSQSCREVVCPPSRSPSRGKCVQAFVVPKIKVRKVVFKKAPALSKRRGNCILVKLDEDGVINSTDSIKFRGQIFNVTEYVKNTSGIFVCSDKLPLLEVDVGNTTLYHFDAIESYLSLTGLIISIIALSVTLFSYILFPQLLNIPGKNLVCLVLSLIVSQTVFLIAPRVSDNQVACAVLAIVMHFFYLCAFCWMNVISFDLLMTFSHTFVASTHNSRYLKRFLMYNLYGWCIPLIITGIAVIFNYTVKAQDETFGPFKPNYGEIVCWINSKYALLLFFAGPLALLKLFDFIAFGFTVYCIAKDKHQVEVAKREKSSSLFCINMRLSVVMGLTWAFAFIANFTNNSYLWFLFILCNTLQGLFIAISFLCTKRVLRLIGEKFHSVSVSNSDSRQSSVPNPDTCTSLNSN